MVSLHLDILSKWEYRLSYEFSTIGQSLSWTAGINAWSSLSIIIFQGPVLTLSISSFTSSWVNLNHDMTKNLTTSLNITLSIVPLEIHITYKTYMFIYYTFYVYNHTHYFGRNLKQGKLWGFFVISKIKAKLIQAFYRLFHLWLWGKL